MYHYSLHPFQAHACPCLFHLGLGFTHERRVQSAFGSFLLASGFSQFFQRRQRSSDKRRAQQRGDSSIKLPCAHSRASTRMLTPCSIGQDNGSMIVWVRGPWFSCPPSVPACADVIFRFHVCQALRTHKSAEAAMATKVLKKICPSFVFCPGASVFWK